MGDAPAGELEKDAHVGAVRLDLDVDLVHPPGTVGEDGGHLPHVVDAQPLGLELGHPDDHPDNLT